MLSRNQRRFLRYVQSEKTVDGVMQCMKFKDRKDFYSFLSSRKLSGLTVIEESDNLFEPDGIHLTEDGHAGLKEAYDNDIWINRIWSFVVGIVASVITQIIMKAIS